MKINNILLELNLFSRPSKIQRDSNLPWNIAAPGANYTPHTQVRPLTTDIHNYQQQQNLAVNSNKQATGNQTANFIKGIKLPQVRPNSSLNLNSSALLPQTKVTSLHQQVSNNVPGLKVPPSARYVNWKNMSPLQIN